MSNQTNWFDFVNTEFVCAAFNLASIEHTSGWRTDWLAGEGSSGG
jgi:hypothetical protein